MKRVFIAAVLILLTYAPMRACDICGCAVGGNYMGILPQFYNNFVGLRYQYRSFRSEHPPLFGEPNGLSANEYFQTTELWGRWNPTRRVQVFAFVPYQHFIRHETNANANINNLGDVSLIANWVIWNTGDSIRNDWKHALQFGGGIKLPTGRYNLTQQGAPLHRNMQPGTGSLDVPLNAIYTVRYKRLGINTEANIHLNTTAPDGHRFGNRLGASLRGFYWQQVRRTTYLPSAGIVWERAAADQLSGLPIEFTGGQSTWLSAGFDVFISRIALGVLYQQPLYNNIGEGYVQPRPRVSAQVAFLF